VNTIGSNSGTDFLLDCNSGDDVVIANNGSPRIKATSAGVELVGVYGDTCAGGITTYINSSGALGTTTSTRKTKKLIKNICPKTLANIMKLRPRQYKYRKFIKKNGKYTYLNTCEDTQMYGLIYDETIDYIPEICIQKNGEPLTIETSRLIIPMLDILQKQQKRIEDLETINKRNPIQNYQKQINDFNLQMKQINKKITYLENENKIIKRQCSTYNSINKKITTIYKKIDILEKK